MLRRFETRIKALGMTFLSVGLAACGLAPQATSAAPKKLDLDHLTFAPKQSCSLQLPRGQVVDDVGSFTVRNHGFVEVQLPEVEDMFVQSIDGPSLECPFYYLAESPTSGGFTPFLDPTLRGQGERNLWNAIEPEFQIYMDEEINQCLAQKSAQTSSACRTIIEASLEETSAFFNYYRFDEDRFVLGALYFTKNKIFDIGVIE